MAEVLRFGLVGLVGLVVDAGTFNLLRFVGDDPVLADRPLTAKALSMVLATIVTYFGNRHWTYADRPRVARRTQYSRFLAVNVVAFGIPMLTLAGSHYVLGLDSPLADNVAANVIGLAAGTVFRFIAYRRWVFPVVGARRRRSARAEAAPTQGTAAGSRLADAQQRA